MYIIGLDDGHGINTSGKRSPDNYKENNFNHYTKEYLKEELKYNGFKIVDCSPSRQDNSLQNRVNIERKNNCNCFISIHYNAMGTVWQKYARGIETYYHIGSKNGKKLATLVHNELLKNTPTINRGCKIDTLLFKNGLYVLRETKSPAILVECGFMDNKIDRVLMESDIYRKECAMEITKGICKFFNKTYKSKTVILKENYEKILEKISPYSNVWKKFIKEHNEVNLPGLIENLYYYKK